METLQACNLCRSDSIETVDADCNLCRCRACGFVFDSPRPAIEDLVGFYSQPAKYDLWLRQKTGRDALWKRRLRKLAPYRAQGNLLDVGAGIGQFLHHARPFFTEVNGTEVSESAIALARERYGLNLWKGQLEELNLPNASFANITLFHVLEHVFDPRGLLRRCHELLRAGGILVVAVPNELLSLRSVGYRIGKKMGFKSFRDFSSRLGIIRSGSGEEIHLSHFTTAVLHDLLESEGFTIVDESLDPAYPSTGLRLALDSVYYHFHRIWSAVFGVNRYDAIWIAARKDTSSA